jgi:hypothetical protein
VLAAAGLAALTGIAFWYLRANNLLDRLWDSTSNRRKNKTKKSVVIIVDKVSFPHMNIDPADLIAVYLQETPIF